MTYLRELENGLTPRITTPFDILVRNFFDDKEPFNPISTFKLKHPVDVYETKDGLHLDVACTGLKKEDVDLNIEGDILKVSYTKDDTEKYQNREYHYSGIAKRSFNFGYKVTNRFNLSEAEAKMDYGLLKITIPYAPHIVASPKEIKIK